MPQEHQIGMRPDKRENKSKNKKQTNQSSPPPDTHTHTQTFGKDPVNFIGSRIHFSLVTGHRNQMTKIFVVFRIIIVSK